MERFFILDKYNTWYDWRLVLTAKDVTPPEAKTNYVDIDGMSGSLDLSEALTGEITYRDRTITASFWTCTGNREERNKLLRNIVTALHGKKIKIIEPDDPEHYFYGRVKIKAVKNIVPYAEFTIEATCDPWRYALAETERRVDVSGKVDAVIINNGVKTVSPIVTVDGSVSITFNGVTTELTDGIYRISGLVLSLGVNVVKVSGNGSITFTYTEADL